MKIIADRMEGEYIVVELPDRSTANLPKCLVPEAKEGDVISICIDAGETEKRRLNAKEKLKKMFDRQ